MKGIRKILLASLLTLTMAGSVSAASLSGGMKGSEVSQLQQQLIDCGYFARQVDGDYGSTTVKAVELFQKDHGIRVTGIADDATQAAIKRAKGGTRTGGGVLIAEGNTGGTLITYQQILQAKGNLKGGVDGRYGPGTVKAVSDFQKASGFPVSGVIDESTASALQALSPELAKKINKGTTLSAHQSVVKSASSGAAASKVVPSRAAPSSGGRTYLFGKGDQGPDVASIQNKLKKAGFLSDKADGIYGDNTVKAVSAFQKKIGIPVTGNVDARTLSVLNRVIDKGNRGTGSQIEDELTLGDSGDRVIKLQNLLLLHGYNPGGVDGQFGNGTKQAVMKLQKKNSMPLTGVVDEGVWNRLSRAPSLTGDYKQMMSMQATAYAPNVGGTGFTYSGNYAGKGHAAVDPAVIPIGSILFVEGYGYCIADDIGRSVKGNIIDVGVDTIEQAYNWGSKQVKVYLVR
jgi:peptidoglycan hydrolase-like protein with peptidoglycan-binding domain